MWNRRISYHLAVHAHRAGLPPVDFVSIDHDDLVTPPGFRIEPVSIVRRAPPAVSHSLVSSNPRRTKQSFSLSRSTNERRGPESCSSFRSSGALRRVRHRRLRLSEECQVGGAPRRFLARPGCGTRRCVGPKRARTRSTRSLHRSAQHRRYGVLDFPGGFVSRPSGSAPRAIFREFSVRFRRGAHTNHAGGILVGSMQRLAMLAVELTSWDA